MMNDYTVTFNTIHGKSQVVIRAENKRAAEVMGRALFPAAGDSGEIRELSVELVVVKGYMTTPYGMGGK